MKVQSTMTLSNCVAIGMLERAKQDISRRLGCYLASVRETSVANHFEIRQLLGEDVLTTVM